MNSRFHRLRDHALEFFPRLVCAMLIGCGVAGELPGQAQASRRQDGFFYSGDNRVRITIIADSVAVILREDATRRQLDSVAARAALVVTRHLSGATSLLANQKSHFISVGTNALVRGRIGAGVVEKAGLMVRAEGARSPMFMTNEILVEFAPTAPPVQIQEVLGKYRLRVVPERVLSAKEFVVQLTDESPYNVLTTANHLHRELLVRYAQPNFIVMTELRGGGGGRGGRWSGDGFGGGEGGRAVARFIPNDPLFDHQWHLNNTGSGGGTIDADIDAPEAWALTLGSDRVVIAIIDNGFDMTHPDLEPNLWVNEREIPDNGVDDDKNNYPDDAYGWDVVENDGNPAAKSAESHGTAVAGAAAARGNNRIGVSGSCPYCRLMLIRLGEIIDIAAPVQALDYARLNGASVIVNSWGLEMGPGTERLQKAIDDAAARAVVLFAMTTTGLGGDVDDCGGTDPITNPDVSADSSVIAVSASNNADARSPSGQGACMDLLGPTDNIGAGVGSLFAATTDKQGLDGYNAADPRRDCPAEVTNTQDYTLCFGGTSFAAPVVAGIAGLVLSVSPGLTPPRVRWLLNDAADKVQDSAGQYDSLTGFSPTHGFGRVNAFEAVRIVAPPARGGRGGVDVFLRDNRLDWGNTEQPSSTLFEPVRSVIDHWTSMDIKVDAPPYRTAPTVATFDSFRDETPSTVPGGVNRVYVRIRNRGPLAAAPVTVRLFWAQHGASPPPLPPDFWTAFPQNSAHAANRWTALPCYDGSSSCGIASVAYSGSSVAGTAADVAQIAQFYLLAPQLDPTLLDQITLLAIVDAPADRPLPLGTAGDPRNFDVEWLTPNDNNVTHRRYTHLRIGRSPSR